MVREESRGNERYKSGSRRGIMRDKRDTKMGARYYEMIEPHREERERMEDDREIQSPPTSKRQEDDLPSPLDDHPSLPYPFLREMTYPTERDSRESNITPQLQDQLWFPLPNQFFHLFPLCVPYRHQITILPLPKLMYRIHDPLTLLLQP